MTISNTELREAARHAIAAQKNMGVAPATMLRLLDENERKDELSRNKIDLIETLKAENAALVKERDHLMAAGAELLATVDSADDEIVVLKDDNARLLKRIEALRSGIRCDEWMHEGTKNALLAADDTLAKS